MDLRQLSNFVRIVDAGSLTRAASQIGVAQPALTYQIANLEEELGTSLLIRSASGVRPTEAGLVLYREARSTMRQVGQISEMVRIANDEPAGQVTIGFPSVLASFFSAPLVGAVRAKFPRIKLQLYEGESAQQRSLLVNNRVELALICEYKAAEQFDRLLLFSQRLALLCDGRTRQDRAGDPISMTEAAARVVALPSVGNPVRAAVDAGLSKLGLSIEPLVEANSLRTLVGAVEQGLGPAITLWMPPNVGPVGSRLVFRPIIDPDLQLDISMNRSKATHLSPAALNVQQILTQVVFDRIRQPDWPGAMLHEKAP
ncbi:MAG: LysR substrate-binding domain-containing protein [Pseudolabrys sp.]